MLPESEYQSCSPAHRSAGATTAPDGRRMSNNVEIIGGSLMVQHYIEDVGQPDHLRLVSSRTYLRLLENLCAVASAGVTYIPPVVALVIGVFLLGDSINPIGYAAMILILSGVAAQPCQQVGKRLQTRRARRHTWLVFRLCEEIIVR